MKLWVGIEGEGAMISYLCMYVYRGHRISHKQGCGSQLGGTGSLTSRGCGIQLGGVGGMFSRKQGMGALSCDMLAP
jgi:hypothetical protein